MSATSIAEAAIKSTNLCGKTRIISIDGPAGSGKTTLARNLIQEISAQDFSVEVVHMDDLYESWSQDLVEQFGYKLNDWIIAPLLNGACAQYLRFDWIQSRYSEQVTVADCDFLILEGVGSGNSHTRSHIACSVWVEADVELRLERVVARDGESVREPMLTWQKTESEYFAIHAVKEHAQFHVRGQ